MGANGFACMGVVGRRCTSSSTAKQGKQRHVFDGKSRSTKPAQATHHNQAGTTEPAQPTQYNQPTNDKG